MVYDLISGVPVVHDSGGPREIVDSSVGFRYIDLNEAAEKIRAIIENRELYSKLSRNARRKASEFDAENFKTNLISTLQLFE